MSAANKPTTSKVSNTSIADAFEDELITWLQYPTDDAFERSYCSDVFQGGWQLSVEAATRTLPGVAIGEYEKNGTLPSRQTTLDNETQSMGTRTSLTSKQMGPNTASIPRLSRNSNAEEALAQGAARAAGYSSQVGQDAYSKVRTIMQPTHAYPQSSTPCDSLSSCKRDKGHPVKPNLPVSSVPAFPVSPPQNVRSTRISILDPPSFSRAKNPTSKTARMDFDVHSHTHQTESSRVTEEGITGQGRVVEAQTQTPLSCSAASQTSMSLSSREMDYCGKRKQEDSDLLSEEYANEDSMDVKKHFKFPSKRNRIAEVHNLSERNRRNRINEKLKALQELIPNSTKTDKASVLDEAIEYMKTLQMQLQMVSMRNSVNVTTVMMPMSLPQPHLQMAQSHSIGLGVPIGYAGGMGMSFGAGTEIGPPTTPASLQYPAAMSQHAIPFQGGSMTGVTYMGFPQSTQISPAMQNMQEQYELLSQNFPYVHQIQQQEQGQNFRQHPKHAEPTSEKDY